MEQVMYGVTIMKRSRIMCKEFNIMIIANYENHVSEKRQIEFLNQMTSLLARYQYDITDVVIKKEMVE